MKRNLLMKKLTAALLTGAMVVSVGGMTAFAEPTEPGSEEEITTTEPGEEEEGENTQNTQKADVYITKKLNKPSEVVLPNVTYTFSVAYSDELTGVSDDEIEASMEQDAVSLKKADGSLAKTATIAKTDTDGNGIGDPEYTYQQKIEVVVDESKFNTPGTYVYTITEDKVDPAYEGLGTDGPLTFEVVYGYQPLYEDEEDQTKITGYAKDASILYKGFVDGDGEKSSGEFTDDYGAGTQLSKLNNITITKKLTGNQADPTKKFNFTITITPGSSNTGKQYSILEAGAQNPKVLEVGVNGATFELTGGQSATIYGLSSTDKYEITENDYGKTGTDEGYTTSWEITRADSATATDNDKSKVEHSVSTEEKTVSTTTGAMVTDVITFTNHKHNATPTGIAMTFAPYIAMVAFAGVFAVMFLRKKREDF